MSAERQRDGIDSSDEEQNSNLKPIIGVLTQPTSSVKNPKLEEMGKSFLPASYVKWIESAGGRAVPIPYDAEEDVIEAIFKTINGLLLPGGDVYLPGSIYHKNTKLLYNLAIKANDEKDYFPIWGTCQGFEQLLMITSGNDSCLESFDAEDMAVPLVLLPGAENAKLFRHLSTRSKHAFASEEVCEMLHSLGISPEGFLSNGLDKFYKVLSNNLDKQDKEYVATMEAHKYPFWGVQWHPERNQFEWDPEEPIDHTLASLECVQYVANFFVQQARRNQHEWTKVHYDIAYVYSPRYTLDLDRYYVSIYFFDD